MSDSFSMPPYVEGDLVGQQGWTSGSVTSDLVDVRSTGLEHAGMLGETGGSLSVDNSNFVSSAVVVAPTFSADSALGSTTQYWFAALVAMTDNAGGDYNYISMKFDGGNSTYFSFGLLDNQFVFNGSTAGYVGTQYGVAGETGTGETALIVGRMTVTDEFASSSILAGKETFDFWFNPTDATSIASLTSSAQGTILGDQSLSHIYGDWGAVDVKTDVHGSAGLNYYQDEIRVGTSMSDLNLAVIPEPNSALWFGLGVLALGLGRRCA
ncbi:hypothetical protein SH580_06805 [Coraliomargarita algicola]|uniref:PEP-CTERM protein-sorting domain-containing protein n=1 Tax=Coraliomargarita algicola TaxID=3092156 RepID=A0ABZ0RQN9_9BACT|nr:hypothetical protein [Coraliomargarita sp. J2-16]WPJ97418.1 hypothetical protein SH580_06805 [Coraliomargarita sp. J2-16]